MNHFYVREDDKFPSPQPIGRGARWLVVYLIAVPIAVLIVAIV